MRYRPQKHRHEAIVQEQSVSFAFSWSGRSRTVPGSEKTMLNKRVDAQTPMMIGRTVVSVRLAHRAGMPSGLLAPRPKTRVSHGVNRVSRSASSARTVRALDVQELDSSRLHR